VQLGGPGGVAFEEILAFFHGSAFWGAAFASVGPLPVTLTS
jgi:hypothetical protein